MTQKTLSAGDGFVPTECDIRAMKKIEEEDKIERMYIEKNIEDGIEFPLWWEQEKYQNI